MTELSDKLIEKLKKSEIKPKPRWQFLLRDLTVWLGGFAFLSIAALSFAMLWHVAGGLDLGMDAWLRGAPFIHGKSLLILLLLIILGVVLLVIDFKKTKRGYRYGWPLILVAGAILTLFIALLLRIASMPDNIDRRFSGKLPFYQGREQLIRSVWQDPINGRIAGEVISVVDSKSFVFKDLKDKEWMVNHEGARWRHELRIEPGSKLKIMGKSIEREFKAYEIRPLMPMNGGCKVEPLRKGCMMRW